MSVNESIDYILTMNDMIYESSIIQNELLLDINNMLILKLTAFLSFFLAFQCICFLLFLIYFWHLQRKLCKNNLEALNSFFKLNIKKNKE